MATTTFDALNVLYRERGEFTNDAGQQQPWGRAVCVDEATGDLVVVSAQPQDLAAFPQGETVGPVEVEVVETTNIRATKVRPVGARSGGRSERF